MSWKKKRKYSGVAADGGVSSDIHCIWGCIASDIHFAVSLTGASADYIRGASAVFLVIALFFVIFIKQKTAGSRILSETRKQLSEDLNCLKRDDE